MSLHNVIATTCCQVTVPDNVMPSPYEWTCVNLILAGALPLQYEGADLRATRDEYGALRLSRRVVHTAYAGVPEGEECIYSFVVITSAGIHDAGILVFEKVGRHLVRTDHGHDLGWRIPAGHSHKED